MSKPVTESAFASAWPGSGFPNSSQSRTIHGAKTSDGDERRRPRRGDLGGAGTPGRTPDHDEPGEADADRLVAGQRGQPDEDAQADQPPVDEPARLGLAQ